MSKVNPLWTELPVVNLRPGELHVAREPTLITTVLGSCVAVCLFCPIMKLGAMCHGVMPLNRKKVLMEDSFRFVDSSVSYMVDVLSNQQGVQPAKLEVKLFGGADVLDVKGKFGKGAPSIGSQNIDSARKVVLKHGLRISVERVGGVRGYKLFFYSHTGEMLLKWIPRYSVRGSDG